MKMTTVHLMRVRRTLWSKLILICLAAPVLSSCHKTHWVYSSNCSNGIIFRKVEFSELIRHIQKYDQQYVEVSGKYVEAKEQSALYNDSLFTDHSPKHALWVNFSQDCPLYLKGTHKGLFEPNNGEFTPINNKKIRIRGKIDLHNHGHLRQYAATIDRISLVEL
ncbi:MAG TPA: hypothetical protein VHA56_21040 [Mucilaginibacter sp.]|nr:hypothetical protein [Mucilaginibacter sp.]